MPNSVVLLNIGGKGVTAELQLPLSELQLAVPFDVTTNTETLVQRIGPQLVAYILKHFKVETNDGVPWRVSIRSLMVKPVEGTDGKYRELLAFLDLDAPENASVRQFILNYDVVIHQLVTHNALVTIRNDWDNGINVENSVDVGVIALDIPSNTIPPLKIDLQEGSTWQGFKSIVMLGIHHISEGIDHLLFLLVLLLPAPLIASRKRWENFGGAKYSLIRLFKIVTAFTIGHSVTLLAGVTGLFYIPEKLVEIIIALSIFVSAIHAIRPLFAGREALVSGVFGLVHGLAFATILVDLNLDGGKMAWSIFAFNIGIELMQIFVIAITVPWLMLISRTSYYLFVRIGGASFAMIASLVWLVERSFDTSTIVSPAVAIFADYSLHIIGVLALFSIVVHFLNFAKVGAD